MADLYRIAVRLSMASHGPAALAGLSRHVGAVHVSAGTLNRTIAGLGPMAMSIGAAMVTLGVGMLSGLKGVTDHAKTLSRETALLRGLGLRQGQIDTMDRAARVGSQTVLGSTEAQNLKFQREAYSVFGAENATAIMPYLSKFAQLSGDVNGGDYGKGEEDVIKVIRSGDLMGKFIDERTGLANPAKVKAFMDVIGRMVVAGGGMFDAGTMLALAQQGGPALSGMSDDGLMSMFMAAQDMGGFRAGTAVSSLRQQFTGGTMTRATAEEAHRLGLIGGFTMAGNKVKLGAGETEFQRALGRDPLEAAKILEGLMAKDGKTSKDDQIKELYKLLSRQTSQRLIADIVRNLTNKTAERGRVEGIGDLDSLLADFNARDYGTAEHNLAAAWENLMQAVAGPASKVTIDAMHLATGALDALTEKVRSTPPETILTIAAGLGSIGLIAGLRAGSMVLMALGPVGWIALGIGALAAVATYFKPDWPSALMGWMSGPVSPDTPAPTDNIGALPQSFGGDRDGLLHRMAYGAHDSAVARAVSAGVVDGFRTLMGASSAGLPSPTVVGLSATYAAQPVAASPTLRGVARELGDGHAEHFLPAARRVVRVGIYTHGASSAPDAAGPIAASMNVPTSPPPRRAAAVPVPRHSTGRFGRHVERPSTVVIHDDIMIDGTLAGRSTSTHRVRLD